MKQENKPGSASVGIVVVNWNGWRDTLDCIASLETLAHTDWHAFVVDNASTDDSVARLRNLDEHITLIRSAVNSGWAGGNNLGIRAALQAGCDYLWLINNDVAVTPESLGQLVRAYQRHGAEYGFFGCLVEYFEPSDWYQYAGTKVDVAYGLPEKLALLRTQVDHAAELIDVHYVYGCALFLHRRVIDEIGLIDERFFLNYDESDWCYRGAEAGWKSAIVTGATVRHKGSATIGGGDSPLNAYFMTRNALLFTRKHGRAEQHNRLLIDTLKRLRWMAQGEGRRHWLLSLLRPRTAKLKATALAARDYLLGRFGDCPPAVRRAHRAAKRS